MVNKAEIKRSLVILVVVLLIFVFHFTVTVQSTGLPLNWDKSACLIESFRRDSSFFATGFFVTYEEDSLLKGNVFLVTNRHMVSTKKQFVSGFDSLRITYYNEDSKISIRTVMFPPHRQSVSIKIHPDTIVDVAVVNLNFKDMLSTFKVSEFGSVQGFLGEDVFFFGYPLHGRQLRNLKSPLLRKGIVSFIAPDPVTKGKTPIPYESFLIDGFALGGNSGSPVILPRVWIQQGLIGYEQRYYLIGIVNASIVDPKPVCPKDSAHQNCPEDSVNTGLAQAFSSNRIREVINLFKKK